MQSSDHPRQQRSSACAPAARSRPSRACAAPRCEAAADRQDAATSSGCVIGTTAGLTSIARLAGSDQRARPAIRHQVAQAVLPLSARSRTHGIRRRDARHHAKARVVGVVRASPSRSEGRRWIAPEASATSRPGETVALNACLSGVAVKRAGLQAGLLRRTRSAVAPSTWSRLRRQRRPVGIADADAALGAQAAGQVDRWRRRNARSASARG